MGRFKWLWAAIDRTGKEQIGMVNVQICLGGERCRIVFSFVDRNDIAFLSVRKCGFKYASYLVCDGIVWKVRYCGFFGLEDYGHLFSTAIIVDVLILLSRNYSFALYSESNCFPLHRRFTNCFAI